MLKTLMKLYVTAMTHDVRSPTPHLVGPPGCGKSTSAEQLAELLGVNLHVINVSRMSPLEIEGVQMPVDGNTRLSLLTATFWTQLNEGDIVLFDEFLRGFPEVYNGLLDVFTSRVVGGFKLPKVFIMAASNSVTTYDKALEDRLLHIKVDDPRKSKRAKNHMAWLLVDEIGLLPLMATSVEMDLLLSYEVLPMFDMLDQFDGKGATGAVTTTGHSVRNLRGQAQMRQIQSAHLLDLLNANNDKALQQGKPQYVVLPDGANPDQRYLNAIDRLAQANLTDLQRSNLQVNQQLIELHEASKQNTTQQEVNEDDDVFF